MSKKKTRNIRAAYAAALALGLALGAAPDADAVPLPAIAAAGTGPFNNSPALIIDGVVPAEASPYNGPQMVHWVGTGVTLTIDLGAVFILEDLLVSVDNNDGYAIETSTGGGFSALSFIAAGDGEIGFGMDTMNTFSGDPEYVANLDFAPVSARFVRIRATSGDRLYSVGEVQAFGRSPTTDMPEPGTVALLGVALGLGLARKRRGSPTA